MQNSQEWFAYRQPAIGEKTVRLSSHPLLGSCLEELAAAVAGCPLERRDVGGAAMVAVHDGWQRGEEGRRSRGLLQAAVDVWHIGARQTGHATLGVAARVANVAEPWWPWRLGARGHGEAWWCRCCHLAAPVRSNGRAMPSFFLRVEETPAGASYPTHRMEVARLMEIGLQHEQHSKTGQNGGSKVCEHRKCCLRWQLPTAMDVGKVKGSPSPATRRVSSLFCLWRACSRSLP